MNYEEKPFFEVEGVFYTYQDGAISGYAKTDGESWDIATNNGENLHRSTIYLDRDKKVIAPRNLYQKNWAYQRINSLIDEYQTIVDNLTAAVNLLKIGIIPDETVYGGNFFA